MYGDRSTHFMAINQYLKLNDPASEIVEHEKAVYSEEWILTDINHYMLYKISICCWDADSETQRSFCGAKRSRCEASGRPSV